jgi:hypothetical protein
MPPQRRRGGGPDLPYRLIAGVEPCPGGWLLVPARLQGITAFPFEPEVFPTFAEILDYRPAYDVIAIRGRRVGEQCDPQGAASARSPQILRDGGGNLEQQHLPVAGQPEGRLLQGQVHRDVFARAERAHVARQR